MDILVIAPEHADLPNASIEIAAIKRHHPTTIVIAGIVRERDITRAVDGGDFDIIWWISHGSPAGVLLTDGLLSIAGVGQYVAASGAKLCILNTCDSEDVAEAIIAGGKSDIICTISPVLNQDAIRLGSLLAGELASCDSFHDAYQIVAPTGGPYRYLSATAHYRRYSQLAPETDPRALADRVRIQVMLIGVYVLIVMASIGLYREIIVLEQGQVRMLQEIRDVEQRMIQMQIDRPTPFAPFQGNPH